MKRFKSNINNSKGITMVALVITIILMLILAGVSVTSALNGGLFSTAERAVDQTQKSEDKEMLFDSLIKAMTNSDTVDIQVIEEDLPDWTIEEVNNEYKCTSPNGNKFLLTKYGDLTDINE